MARRSDNTALNYLAEHAADGKKQRIENNGTGLPVYIGLALPGLSSGSEGWAIRKITYSGTSITQVDWADGTNEATKIWDDRATYTYS